MKPREFSEEIKKESNVKPPEKNYLKSEEKSNTTAVRISTEYYEILRQKAFNEKTSVRQLVDEILAEKLDK